MVWTYKGKAILAFITWPCHEQYSHTCDNVNDGDLFLTLELTYELAMVAEQNTNINNFKNDRVQLLEGISWGRTVTEKAGSLIRSSYTERY